MVNYLRITMKGLQDKEDNRRALTTELSHDMGEVVPSNIIQEEDINFITRPLFPQLVMITCVNLGFLVYGMGLSHTAVLIPRLQEENNTFTLNDQEAATIVSIYSIISPLGYMFGGIITDFWGRRKMIILGHVAYIVGWITIAAAQNVSTILAGRIIEGIAKGIVVTTGAVYADEFTDPRLRGVFSNSMKISILLGILLILLLGTLLHWRTAAAIAMCGDLLAIVGFLVYIPETPSWLIRKSRLRDAHASLTKIWGPGRDTQVQNDIKRISGRIKSKENKSKIRNGETLFNFWQIILSTRGYFKPCIVKPFFIGLIFLLFQCFWGNTIITAYKVDIISKLKGDDDWIDSYIISLVITAVEIISLVILCYLLLVIGRRTIGLSSGVATVICASVLIGVLYYEITADVIAHGDTIVWVKILIFILYNFTAMIGLGMLPFIMMGEMLPTKVRGLGTGLIIGIYDVLSGVSVALYPSIMNAYGISGLFLLFGISALVCTAFVFLFLPETHGKRLEEIETYFLQPNIMWITGNSYRKVKQNEQSL
ncbi:facilitated trehalose transporter Tret1-like [Periplaneta americana]|uniref:facilitated trehalose transporter Tret1-like n=1 Tax=Periplaneta americana TaxID=6978 RepID=UPI0037E9725A